MFMKPAKAPSRLARFCSFSGEEEITVLSSLLCSRPLLLLAASSCRA